jgi:hypothetical protein
VPLPTWSANQSVTVDVSQAEHLTGYDAMDPDADHFQMAIDLVEDGNIDGAVASFRACARFSPSSESFLNLGMALLEPELTSMRQAAAEAEAVLAFEKALTLNPRDHEAKDQLILLREKQLMSLRAKVGKDADAMAKTEAETKAKMEADAKGKKETESERKKLLKGLFAHLREGGVVAFKRVQIITIERFGASHPTTTAPDFIQALIAHLRESSRGFSQKQLAAIEIFGASHGLGVGGDASSLRATEEEDKEDSIDDLPFSRQVHSHTPLLHHPPHPHTTPLHHHTTPPQPTPHTLN